MTRVPPLQVYVRWLRHAGASVHGVGCFPSVFALNLEPICIPAEYHSSQAAFNPAEGRPYGMLVGSGAKVYRATAVYAFLQ